MNRQASQEPELDWTSDLDYHFPERVEEARRMRVSAPKSIDTAFKEFHFTHPGVYYQLENLATQWFDRGHQRLGMKALWERARWEMTLYHDAEKSEYKLNNSYTSRYARLLLERHPEWKGRIKTRTLRSL